MLRLLTVSLTGRATTGTMLTLLVGGCDVYTPDLVSEDGTTLEGDNGTDGTDDTDGADSTSDGIDTSATGTSDGDSLGTSGASTTTNATSNSLTADDTASGDDSGSASTNSGSNSDSSTTSTDTAQNDSNDADTASNDDGSGTTTTGSTAAGEGGAGSTMADAVEEPDDSEGGSTSVVIGAGGAGSDEPLTPTPLIDDMEDGDAVIVGGSDRMGTWFTFNDCQDTEEDCSGTQTPEAGETFMMESGGYESDYAAHSAASGFEVWGSGFGVNLNGGTQAYDASMFSGISFWAKGALDPAGAVLRVEFVSTTTDAESSHFGFDICLSSDWQLFSLPFSDSTQPTWAMDIVASLDPASIKSINFKTAENVDHDVWLDDLVFSEGAASEELHCE